MAKTGGDLTVPLDRNRLISDMGTARSRVRESVAGLTDEQASRPGIDGWSAKDHLNHLTACDELRFHEIHRISSGGRPAFAGMDGVQADVFNEIIVSLRRALPLDQVTTDLQSARTRVLQAIAAAPERALDPAAYGDGYPVNGSIAHDAEHAAAIMAWRKREGT
jgi:hypothetical protein